MGFSLAMWAAQRVRETVLVRAGLSFDRLLRDGQAPSSLEPGEPVHMAYVDNFAVIGTDPDRVQDIHRQALRAVRECGFDVHEVEEPSTQLDVVGVHIDGVRGRVSLSSKRHWKLCAALHEFVRIGRCSGKDMKCILGHLCVRLFAQTLLSLRPLSVLSVCDRRWRWLQATLAQRGARAADRSRPPPAGLRGPQGPLMRSRVCQRREPFGAGRV